jgi:phytoene dehydrogenase-like protein
MEQVVAGLVNIAKGLGVQLRSGTKVTRILMDGGRAAGVELENGEQIRADVVVTNR